MSESTEVERYAAASATSPLPGDVPLEGIVVEEGFDDQPPLPGEFDDIGWTAPHGGLTWIGYSALVAAKRAVRTNRERKLSSDLWHLSDILNWGLLEFGQEFYQLFDETHYEKESLSRIAAVGAAFERDRRWKPDEITFWTHYEVHTLDPNDADDLLEAFYNGEMNRSELRAEANRLRGNDSGSGSSGSGNDDGQGKLLDTCPLCDGVGEVTPDRRRAYLHEEMHGA